MTERLRVCFVCTHSLTLSTLYKGLFPYLRKRGFEVDAIVGDHEYSDFPAEHFGALQPRVIPMTRTPSPFQDLIGLVRFVAYFATHRYDVVHVSTPKASLLASIAARLTFNGPVMLVYRRCVYEMMSGRKRRVYLEADRIITRQSRVVVPISRQLRQFLEIEAVCPPSKLVLLGEGSSNGIDTDRFRPSADTDAAANRLRAHLGIPALAPVVLFIGRMCSEKGVDLLPAIFERVRAAHPHAHLVVAGPDDRRDPPSETTVRYFAEAANVHRVGFIRETEAYYAMCTVFLFPSYFEGFGNVLLEAAAMERASVAFAVPGVTEAVADGVSGLLVSKGDIDAAASAVDRLLRNPQERRRIEMQARQRTIEAFDHKLIWAEVEALMRRLAAGRVP